MLPELRIKKYTKQKAPSLGLILSKRAEKKKKHPVHQIDK